MNEFKEEVSTDATAKKKYKPLGNLSLKLPSGEYQHLGAAWLGHSGAKQYFVIKVDETAELKKGDVMFLFVNAFNHRMVWFRRDVIVV